MSTIRIMTDAGSNLHELFAKVMGEPNERIYTTEAVTKQNEHGSIAFKGRWVPDEEVGDWAHGSATSVEARNADGELIAVFENVSMDLEYSYNSYGIYTASSLKDVLNMMRNDENTFIGGAGADYFDLSDAENVYAGLELDLRGGADVVERTGAFDGGGFIPGFGGDGDDVLQGYLLDGGAGDDRLLFDLGIMPVSRNAPVSLSGGAGRDVADFSLLDGAQGVSGLNLNLWTENPQTIAGKNVDLDSVEGVVGTRFDDRIDGGVGDNTLSGRGGKDVLYGLSGDDALDGGVGRDVLIGGGGADRLTGGASRDFFVFTALGDSQKTGAGRDVILDFSSAQRDQIDLRGIDASTLATGDQAFTLIGTAGFTAGVAGQLRYDAGANGHLYLWGDVNGDRRADFSILVAHTDSLAASDFLL